MEMPENRSRNFVSDRNKTIFLCTLDDGFVPTTLFVAGSSTLQLMAFAELGIDRKFDSHHILDFFFSDKKKTKNN
jgi:hypothetical protein